MQQLVVSTQTPDRQRLIDQLIDTIYPTPPLSNCQIPAAVAVTHLLLCCIVRDLITTTRHATGVNAWRRVQPRSKHWRSAARTEIGWKFDCAVFFDRCLILDRTDNLCTSHLHRITSQHRITDHRLWSDHRQVSTGRVESYLHHPYICAGMFRDDSNNSTVCKSNRPHTTYNTNSQQRMGGVSKRQTTDSTPDRSAKRERTGCFQLYTAF